ncbi:MAG: zinc-ribbon domain-containing protein [Deltaproteobacteria bacterium]|jgi:hypothetical protein|nr:zinc-ribbon domain-containing protein [Deltaproteobacteria bacterium]
MILHCPGCMAKLRMPDSYLERGKEVWIKCPKCGERFRPQRPDLDGELGLSPSAKGPEPGHRKQVEDILSRLDLDKMGGTRETDFGLVLDALPVVPEVPKKTWIFLGLTALLVAGLLGALAWVFHSSGAPPPPQQPAEAPPPPDYGRDLLLPDIMALRRDLLRLRHVERHIDYRGRESRFYKYYTPLLAPDLCQDITALTLWSPRTSDGFMLEGECMNPLDTPATLEVQWDLHTAKIKVRGRDQTVELPLPQPQAPAQQPPDDEAGGPDAGNAESGADDEASGGDDSGDSGEDEEGGGDS